MVVVIGAGPGGLAAAAMLQRVGFRVLVLERGEVAAAWRSRYDRLHLHTVRWLSCLPGYPMPRSYGRWPSRDRVMEYLRAVRRARRARGSDGRRGQAARSHRRSLERRHRRGRHRSGAGRRRDRLQQRPIPSRLAWQLFRPNRALGNSRIPSGTPGGACWSSAPVIRAARSRSTSRRAAPRRFCLPCEQSRLSSGATRSGCRVSCSESRPPICRPRSSTGSEARFARSRPPTSRSRNYLHPSGPTRTSCAGA